MKEAGRVSDVGRVFRPGIIAFLILVSSISAFAQDANPFARAQLARPSETSVVVGESVLITVTAFSPTFFTDAPQWPDTIEVANGIGRVDATRAVNSNERVDGQSFAGISQDYRVFPIAAGPVTVSAISMTMRYALEGAKPSPPVTVATEPLTFTARLPPGISDSDPFVAASAFNLTRRFSRSTDNLKAGDALTETITMSADGAWSAMLPPIVFAPIDGVKTYTKEPITDDKADERGGPQRATRVESATYTFDKPGAVTLPGLTVKWWNPADQQLHNASLAATTLNIAAPPQPASSIVFEDEEQAARDRAAAERAERRRIGRIAAISAAGIAAVALIVWVVWQFGGTLSELLKERAQRIENSESACFRRLVHASESGDARAAYAATQTWFDRIWPQGDRQITLDSVGTLAADAELTAQCRALSKKLFGDPRVPENGWSGREFARLLGHARPRLLEAARGETAESRASLPPLNPM